MPKFLDVTDKAAARAALQINQAEPEQFGAEGDGTTDDTAAFVSLFASAVVAEVRQQYRLENLTVTNRAINGELFNTLIGADPADPVTGLSNPILRLRSGSTLQNVTIDGEDQTSRRVDVGTSGSSNILVQDVVIVDAADQSFRINADTAAFRMLNIYADGSRVFNTEDESEPRALLFSGIICVNSPLEAFLIDLPGTENTEWTGFLISQGIWEASAATKRIISLARCYGGLVTGQVIRGALSTPNPTDSHLLHVEDKAQFVAHVGNVLETNGSARAANGALGSENLNYSWSDKNPKELLYTANLYKATDVNTTNLIWMEGTQPNCFDRLTVVGETLLCNGFAAPTRALAKRSILGGNFIYDATAQERVRTGDSASNNDNSAQGADIVRLPSHHVNPRFYRTQVGHGYNPDAVIFRTSFGFDTYTNFQTWTKNVKTVTGATVATFGGSLGSGTITFVADADSGALFLRATRGSSNMTSRLDLVWDVHDIDFQQLDNFCVRLMTRSSVQNAGKLTMEFPYAGPGMLTQVLNSDASTYSSWKVDGASKVCPTTADFYSVDAGEVKMSLFFGDGLSTAGQTADYALMSVSVNRSTPF